jgi:4-deoxy-L-threo-5-hexosulose-uronate ketol-isomerase
MNQRFEASSREVSTFTNQQIRDQFLIENIFHTDSIELTYTIYDRMIIGGAKPVNFSLELPNPDKLKANYFLERRELGIINVGGLGKIRTENDEFIVNKLDAIYLGKGTKQVIFESVSKEDPALFYILSSPAHASFPNTHLAKKEVITVTLGSLETSNHRTIY